MSLMSARARLLAQDLRDMAGETSPSVWHLLRPIANEAEAIAVDLERSEAFEAQVLHASHREAGHGQRAAGEATAR
ncbi:MAG: hypothetical protein KKE73_09585 [Proteobacteria bacterium]|nr:hypothetical protein [Pseudomonadota bacterium]